VFVFGACQSFVGERFAQCYEGDGVISSITLADFAGFPDLKLENWVGQKLSVRRFATQRRKQNHIADAGAVGQQHH
jgi:hypothetical protein